jgi:hypothetical protein
VTFTFRTLHRAIARLTAVFAIVPLIVGLASADVSAGQRFDGDWAIFIFGMPGPCAFGYRLPITITDGNVLYKGRRVHPTVIGVSSRGAVQIHLSDGRNTVIGTGALDTTRGSGRWTAPNFRCTGYWRAKRR